MLTARYDFNSESSLTNPKSQASMGVSKVVQGDRYCKNGGHQSLKPCKRMALRESPSSAESDLFRQELVNLINLRQPLAQLAQKIDCKSCQGGL